MTIVVFETTFDVMLSGDLPGEVTREQALAILHDHDFIIHCDKNLSKYEEDTDSEDVKPTEVNASFKPTARTRCYKIHDVVKNIPGGIWDSKVDSSAEYTDLESGLFVFSKSPMGIHSDTSFVVQDSAAGLKLICKAEVSCSKLLVLVVKAGYKENLEHLHSTIMKKLVA